MLAESLCVPETRLWRRERHILSKTADGRPMVPLFGWLLLSRRYYRVGQPECQCCDRQRGIGRR